MKPLALILLLLASPAMAQTSVTSDSASSSQSAAGSQSNNANQVVIQSEAPGRQRIDQTFRGNTPVGLAASVSFSSDYCGGTASGGASGFGVSIGAAAPVFDANCQALRRAEKVGMAAVTAHNLGMRSDAVKLERLAVWQLCVVDPTMLDACHTLGLVSEAEMQHIKRAQPLR
jgi:hypothetical protein